MKRSWISVTLKFKRLLHSKQGGEMSLAVLCSQCFVLRVSEMFTVITDTPTPPKKRGLLAEQQPPLPGIRALTKVLLSWTLNKGVCSCPQSSASHWSRKTKRWGNKGHTSDPVPTHNVNCCHASRSWAVSLEQYKESEKETESNWQGHQGGRRLCFPPEQAWWHRLHLEPAHSGVHSRRGQ